MTHQQRVAAIRAQMRRALAEGKIGTYTALLGQLGTLLMGEAQR